MKICISISLEKLGKSGISYRATVGLATSPFLSGTYTPCLPMGPTIALALICIACPASWASLPAILGTGVLGRARLELAGWAWVRPKLDDRFKVTLKSSPWVAQMGKNLPAMQETLGLTPGWGRSLGEGNDNPL